MGLLAIDPGVRLCGWAYFIGAVFMDCGLFETSHGKRVPRNALLYNEFRETCMIKDVTDMIVEIPCVYGTDQQKGDQNDLIHLAYTAGIIVGHITAFRNINKIGRVSPQEWKGSTPKAIHNERVKAKHPEAIPMVERVAKSYQHNVWDAIGLGDWALKQL